MTGSVEIAGGGIAGLTTGLAFARKGWRVRVHEQDGDLRTLLSELAEFSEIVHAHDAEMAEERVRDTQ